METYRIIGGDGQEYGPVSAEEVGRWIAEGRLSGQSQVRPESGNQWRRLGDYPKFAAALGASAGLASSPGTVPPPLSAAALSQQLLASAPQLRVGSCLARAWNLLWANFGLFAGAALLVFLIGLMQFVPVLSLVYGIGFGVLYGGFYLVFLQRIRGQPASLGDIFAGFRRAPGQLVLAGFISSVLGGLGLAFCVIPGLYLMVAWVFCVPLVADKNLEFWPAMELSRKVVTRVWFQAFALLLLVFLPMIAVSTFAAVKSVSLLVPVLHDVFRSSAPPDLGRLEQTIWEIQKVSLGLKLLTRVVLLFNLPFAAAALMYAYEDLFGPRRTASA